MKLSLRTDTRFIRQLLINDFTLTAESTPPQDDEQDQLEYQRAKQLKKEKLEDERLASKAFVKSRQLKRDNAQFRDHERSLASEESSLRDCIDEEERQAAEEAMALCTYNEEEIFFSETTGQDEADYDNYLLENDESLHIELAWEWLAEDKNLELEKQKIWIQDFYTEKDAEIAEEKVCVSKEEQLEEEKEFEREQDIEDNLNPYLNMQLVLKNERREHFFKMARQAKTTLQQETKTRYLRK